MTPHDNEEPWLFDLPLAQQEGDGSEPVEAIARPAAALPTAPTAVRRRATTDTADPAAAKPERLQVIFAGLLDLAVVLSALIAAVAGTLWLGVRPQWSDWPPLVIYTLVFSFLYFVMPLAFWGQTPGMGWAGLIALEKHGEGLTFQQCVGRWLGSILTLLTLGAPWVFSMSLPDRLSGSRTDSRNA